MEWNTPRLSLRLVSLAKKPSTALIQETDDAAFEHGEGGEQGDRAVSFIVVGHGAAAPLLQRQAGLGAIESLDLAFLVHRQHESVLRRIDVEADDVAHLGSKLRVVGQLELPDLMGSQAMAAQNAMHRTDADHAGRGRGGGCPIGGFAWQFG